MGRNISELIGYGKLQEWKGKAGELAGGKYDP